MDLCNQRFIGSVKQEKRKNENQKNEVLVHELADPITLNPILEADANTGYILGNVYQTLLGHDRDDFKTYPLLVDSLPLLTTNLQDSSMEFSFRLRKEASWDDQTPLTSEDVAFALKLFKVPTIECASLRSYFEMFDDIVLDPKNDKKFTIHCNRLYHMAEDAIGGLGLMNPKVFDPKGVLKKYTVKQLSEIKKLDANAIKELDAKVKIQDSIILNLQATILNQQTTINSLIAEIEALENKI